MYAVNCMILYVHVEFTESPSNISVLLGFETEAVFRCRHSTADAISWKVNGLPVQEFPNITISLSSQLYTLTIPARLEYNGTEVVCVALFIGGSLPDEETTPATLTIIAGLVAVYLVNPS